jgi:hypothetical protein
MRQRFEFRQLVSGGRPIDVTKRIAFGNYMRTDGVIAHVSHWIIKSSGGTDDNDEVQKIGPTYGKDLHMHQINILIQQQPIDDPVLLKTRPDETLEERRNRRNRIKKMKSRRKKLIEKINNSQGI